jgi:DNA processing protein
MDQEKIHQVALSMVPGIGCVLAKTLISHCGSASAVFGSRKTGLARIPGIGHYLADAILSFRDFDQAAREIELCQSKGITPLFFTDPAYPRRLKQAPDAPSILYFRGHGDLQAQKVVAMVGTRSCTHYGKMVTEQLIQGLIPHGALIVSGLAYGIDITAHRAAIQAGLPTIAVMASGMDTIYPSAHRDAAKAMQERGGLVTEYRLGVKPEAHLFPARNRIIAGMADVTIVVEAAEKGGALITAELANGYDREVFAVPGNIDRKYSTGCNQLVAKHKAHILSGIGDLEYIMNWEPGVQPDAGAPEFDFSELSAPEQQVMRTILAQSSAVGIDDLSWRSQVPLNRLASILLNLEIRGLVKSMPGKKYKIA